ncbi:MAG: AMP-binding protein [Clostridiales bacterium]|nr:AMP-binding protein [Clostridiales bacterium]
MFKFLRKSNDDERPNMLRDVSDLRDLLNYAAESYGEKAAYLYKKKLGGEYLPISFNQFREDVNNLGNALLEAGYKGKHIALIGENRYEWVVSYLAVACGLGVIVPLDKELPVQEIAALIDRADVSAVIYSSKVGSKLKEALEGREDIDLISMEILSSEGSLKSLKALIARGAELRKRGMHRFEGLPIDPNDFCTLIFTSGTTGLAKGVMLCHRNIAYNVSAMAEYMDASAFFDRKVGLSLLPMHHCFGFTADVLTSLHQGGTLAFCEGLKHVAKNMKEAKISYLIAVPLIYESIHDKIWKKAEESGRADKMRAAIKMIKALSHINKKVQRRAARLFKEVHDALGGTPKLLIAGGAPSDPSVMANFNAMGILMVQGYGMTETSPVITLNPWYAPKHASVGLPLPGTEIRIDDPDSDGIGELLCRSDAVMLGYYKDEEETSNVLSEDGWLRTGDYGYADKDGYYYLTGRKKNVIVTKNGKNIFPEEVEYYLLKSPYIEEVIVRGVQDEGKSDLVVCAEIYPNLEKLEEEGSPTGEALRALIKREVDKYNDKMPLYKRVKRFTLRDTCFEKTTTRKIKRW